VVRALLSEDSAFSGLDGVTWLEEDSLISEREDSSLDGVDADGLEDSLIFEKF
jgi:hypothetical protein